VDSSLRPSREEIKELRKEKKKVEKALRERRKAEGLKAPPKNICLQFGI